MTSVVSRWRWNGESRPERVRLASGDGGALVLDARGRVSLLDARGAATWTRSVEDSMRDIAMPAAGREGLALSVREIVRFGQTGKAVWRVTPPPFPTRLAVRRDGTVFAVAAGQGLVRFFDGATGRDLGGQRLTHAADHVAVLSVEIVGEPRRRGPAAPQPTLAFVVSERGDVTMLDHAGKPAWTIHLGAVAGPPDAAHDRVVVPSFDGVHAWLLDGSPAGLYELGTPASPAVRALLDDSAERLLALDARNRVFLIAMKTGETLWHLQLPEDVADVAFAPDGNAIAIAMRSGAVEWLQVIETASAGAAADVGERAPDFGAMPAATAFEPGATGGFLEMCDGPLAAMRPKPRWRVPVSVASPRLALLHGGDGVALLDAERGELSLWTGAAAPAWRARGLGAWPLLAAATSGTPIVAAGATGVRFFSFDRGSSGAASIDARFLAVAESGAAVLVGSSASRLHLFDAEGRPVWDVPAPRFRFVDVSPDGNGLAIVREDGTVVYQRRGSKGGWTRDLGSAGFLSGDEGPGGEPSRVVHLQLVDDGALFANAAGRAGFVGADGSLVADLLLPNQRGASELVTVGPEVLVRDDRGGWYRFRRQPWRIEPLPKAGAPGGIAESRFAIAMDHLLEFRYDSKEIASIDAATGAVLWKRALTEAPKAVAVAADGSCLAAVVAGELVLYDLLGGATSASTQGPDTQRFLEL